MYFPSPFACSSSSPPPPDLWLAPKLKKEIRLLFTTFGCEINLNGSNLLITQKQKLAKRISFTEWELVLVDNSQTGT